MLHRQCLIPISIHYPLISQPERSWWDGTQAYDAASELEASMALYVTLYKWDHLFIQGTRLKRYKTKKKGWHLKLEHISHSDLYSIYPSQYRPESLIFFNFIFIFLSPFPCLSLLHQNAAKMSQKFLSLPMGQSLNSGFPPRRFGHTGERIYSIIAVIEPSLVQPLVLAAKWILQALHIDSNWLFNMMEVRNMHLVESFKYNIDGGQGIFITILILSIM